MKKFKGVIRDWQFADGRVQGVLEWPKPVNGRDWITTSLPVRVEQRETFVLLETRNSFYILILPVEDSRTESPHP